MMTLFIHKRFFSYNHPVSVDNTYLTLTAFHWKMNNLTRILSMYYLVFLDVCYFQHHYSLAWVLFRKYMNLSYENSLFITFLKNIFPYKWCKKIACTRNDNDDDKTLLHSTLVKSVNFSWQKRCQNIWDCVQSLENRNSLQHRNNWKPSL